MYDITFSTNALKQAKALPREMQERIIAVLERVRIRPEAHFERLVGEKTYKLRVGDYRIIADIQHDRLVILVIEIGHRRNIYKKIKK